MKVLETYESEKLATHAETENTLRFPCGLLGFEPNKEYVLKSNPDQAPFLWLHMIDEPKISFLVMSPFFAMPTYQPDLRNEDVAFLGLESEHDAMIFNIVTVASLRATVNLKGPIVVNRRTRRGKQVIPVNAANYDVNFPLTVATT